MPKKSFPCSAPTPTQLQLGVKLVLVPIHPAPCRPASQRSLFKVQVTIIVKRTFVSIVIKSSKHQLSTVFHKFAQLGSPISINLNFKSSSNLCPVRLMIITLALTITKLEPKAQHKRTEISFYFT